MHLFKHFFKLLQRNRTGLILYGIITFILVMMLVLTVGDNDSVDNMILQAKSYDISYVDNDNSALSKGLIDYLSEENNVTDYSDKDETAISNLVFFYITEYHFTVPEGFMESVENGSFDKEITFATDTGNNGMVSYDLDSRINNYLNAYRDYRFLGYSEEEAISLAKDLVSNTPTMTIVDKDGEGKAASTKEIVLYNINQYYPYLILGMLVLGLGHTILITNKKELVDRNTVAPVPKYMTNLINVLGLITTGTAIWAIFFAFNLIYGGSTELIKNYGWVIGINSYLSMVTACSITALMTNIIKTSNTLSMVTNIVGLAMSFFCGVFVPMRFLGETVLAFAKFLPFYWTVLANNMTSSIQSGYAFDITQIWVCFGVELLFAVAIAAIAIISNPKRIIKA